MPFDSESAKEARAKAAPRGENKLKKLFREYADEDDVKELFDKLKEIAKSGDMDAIKVLLSYLIGKPKESMDLNVDGGIQVILKKADRVETK
jgi:aryl-alcohol dehydrogenase-like predicted oxidoreductase